MQKLIRAASLLFALVACGEQEPTSPAVPVPELTISNIEVVDAETGRVVPGLETIANERVHS